MTTRVVRARAVSYASLVYAAASMVFMAACQVDKASEVDLAGQALATAGSGGNTKGCVPRDKIDSVPDRIDEDCDGRIDEDVDATRANCPAGTHIIEGTRGNDVLRGTYGRDCILGYGGNDTIYGQDGDDVIFAGPGDDRVYPGGGNALVHAGSGDDLVDASLGCGSTVYGEAGRDTLIGGPGTDVFYGGEGNDVLKGGGGTDTLNGGGCNDYVVGGNGRDAAIGGPDVDVCDAESVSECEKTEASRVRCSCDADCRNGERCAANVNFCVPASAANCGSCTATGTVDTTCDGIDDDCDGQVDDDYAPKPVSCGSGSCAANGVTQCVNGQEQNSCAPGTPLPGNDATCDGRDDDCDGQVDDDVLPMPTTCGQGVCFRTGTAACSGGQLIDSCVPGQPTSDTDTTCDGLDDDCNGTADDAFPSMPTSCGSGRCARTGVSACVAGVVVDSCVVTCEGGCSDGIDDDKDGLLDCLDNDCSTAVGCLEGSFGSPCTSNSECDAVGPEPFCITGVPAGYCTRPCSTGCPAGTHCLTGGTSCVVDCGPGGHCGRPDYVCTPVGFPGSESDAFCHGNCALSCPSGTQCNPATYRCDPIGS